MPLDLIYEVYCWILQIVPFTVLSDNFTTSLEGTWKFLFCVSGQMLQWMIRHDESYYDPRVHSFPYI